MINVIFAIKNIITLNNILSILRILNEKKIILFIIIRN